MTAITFRPQTGAQTNFLASSADVAIYGGAAGGGKTFAALMEAARHINNPKFRAAIIRQTYTQITKPGAIWDESQNLYPYLGGKANSTRMEWTFPSGATISFGYLDHPKDRLNYQGAQIALIVYDQLEQISRDNFFYLFSRNRSTCGVRPYVRANCNPDPDSWLAEFISWWLDPETGFPIPERAGKLRYMVRVSGTIVWADTAQELIDRYEGEDVFPKSITFIPAKLTDNPALLKVNPEYQANLMALDYVSRMQLLEGNWKIRHTAGTVFNRAWFKIVDAIPVDLVAVVRHWDRAATEGGGDWTVGLLMGVSIEKMFYVIDVIRGQWGAGDVEKTIKQSIEIDYAKYGQRLEYGFEQEPGSAGVGVVKGTITALAGYAAFADRPTGSKLERAKPYAAQCQAGNVALLRGAWNSAYMEELEDFPKPKHGHGDDYHDDQVDASSGAFNRLTTPAKPKPKPIMQSRVVTGAGLF